MNQTLLRTLAHGAMQTSHRSGLLGLVARNAAPAVTVFMFHGVADTPSDDPLRNSLGLHLAPEAFEKLCRGLASMQRDFPVVSLRQAATALAEGSLPPDQQMVVFTFDDGYRNNLTHAFPILERYELPATVFAATEFIHSQVPLWPDRLEHAFILTNRIELTVTWDEAPESFSLATVSAKRQSLMQLCRRLKDIPQESLPAKLAEIELLLGVGPFSTSDLPEFQRPLSWGDARTLCQSGLVEIGAHTHRHLILGRCQPHTVVEEMTTSLDLLAQNLGSRPDLFAYPNGKHGDFSPATRQALLDAGIRVAVTTELGRNSPATADPLTLSRYGVPHTAAHAAAYASGGLAALSAIRHRFKRR